MSYPRKVTVELLDTDKSSIGTLDNAFDANFIDAVSDLGSGSFSLPLDDPANATITDGMYARFRVGGTTRFTMRIEGDPQYRQIQRGEEHDEVVDYEGRGWGCVWDDALVVPEFRLDSELDSSWRLWSFASPGFPNDSAWVAAQELYEYLDGVSYGKRFQEEVVNGVPYLFPSPMAFPWPLSPNNDPYSDTYWIWPGAANEDDIGFAFFRKTINLTDGAILTLDVTGDNWYTFYIDGVPVVGETDDWFAWDGYKQISIGLTDGPHTLAAVVQNPDWPDGHPNHGVPGTNPGGFIMALYDVDGNNLPLNAYAVSDDSWDSFFSATDWPGWTIGQILDDFITESQGRGAMAAYDRSGETWDDEDDSNGNDWESIDVDDPIHFIPGFAIRVGATGLDLLNQLTQDGWADWHFRPDDLTLDVYNQGTAGQVTAVEFAHGVNISTLERRQAAPYANRLLVQYGEGFFVWVEDAAAIAANGNVAVEDVYSTNAAEVNDAMRLGRIELARRVVDAKAAIVLGVEPTSSADCPYEGFGLFDYVEVPDTDGSPISVQVLSISCTQDAEGYAVWRLELNRRMRVRIREHVELLRTIGGKTTGSVGDHGAVW